MKKQVVAFLMVFIFVAGAFAQQNFVPLVDVEASQSELDQKAARNRELTTFSEQLSQENDQLLDEIKRKQEQISNLDANLFRMREMGEEMESFIRKLTDFNATERTRLNILKNNDAIRTLSNTKAQLERVIYLNRQKLNHNKKLARDYSTEIERNRDKMYYLETAIAKSKEFNVDADAYMKQIKQYLAESEAIIDEVGDALPDKVLASEKAAKEAEAESK